jgi:glucokinase
LRRVVQVAGGDVALVRGEHVQSAAEEGDAEAAAVIDEFARWVALGLVNLTNAYDPSAFVLGGGLAEGAHLYLEPIQRWFSELLYAPDLRPHPTLSFAELGEHAGAIGAALLPGTRQHPAGGQELRTDR